MKISKWTNVKIVENVIWLPPISVLSVAAKILDGKTIAQEMAMVAAALIT